MRKKFRRHDDSLFHHAYLRNPWFRKGPINYSDDYRHDGYDNTETVKKALDLAIKWIKREHPNTKVTLKSRYFNKEDNDGKNTH